MIDLIVAENGNVQKEKKIFHPPCPIHLFSCIDFHITVPLYLVLLFPTINLFAKSSCTEEDYRTYYFGGYNWCILLMEVFISE